MTPTSVSGITQALPLFSEAKQNPLPQAEKVTVEQNVTAQPSDAGAAPPTDTVRISPQSRQAVAGVKAEETPLEAAQSDDTKNKDAAARSDANSTERALSKVQFVYDQKGYLSVRYMDTSDRLVYQIPSELMLSLREAAAKAESSVNTKV